MTRNQRNCCCTLTMYVLVSSPLICYKIHNFREVLLKCYLLHTEWNSTRLGGPAQGKVFSNCTQNFIRGSGWWGVYGVVGLADYP